ncbi:MAG: lipocalin-like domain-containing protein [Saprospiraceae bacterium]|nr:lipocalin-like domain-containing protein [Saprospiraceae bacterium]
MKTHFVFLFMALLVQGQAQNDLMGSWSMEEIHWVTPDTTYSITSAQPGILMVSKSRYAFIWTPTTQPRTAFKVLSAPTMEETKAAFSSIVFNSGRYAIEDGILTTTSTIARVPGFEGGKQMFKISLKGDQLELTMFDETYPSGEKPEWYGKLKTRFLLTRID